MPLLVLLTETNRKLDFASLSPDPKIFFYDLTL